MLASAFLKAIRYVAEDWACLQAQRFEPRDFKGLFLNSVVFTVMAVAWEERMLHVFPNLSHFQSTQVDQ